MLVYTEKGSSKKNYHIHIRVNSEELETLLEKANIYTDGNISKWIRFASTQLFPLGKHMAHK